MPAKVDTLNGGSSNAAELNLLRNRSYVLFLDSRGREISRFIDEFGDGGASTTLNQINLPSILAEMKRILDEEVRGESQVLVQFRRLGEKEPVVRKEAAWILSRMSDRAEVIVPPLVLALKEREPRHGAAVEIIMILAGFGPSAESAIPELVKILQDKTLSSPVRQRAAYSLGRIDTEGVEVVPVLSKMLRDPDRDVVIGAAAGLGVMGGKAAGAIPSLEKALASTQDEKARGYLGKALESVQAGK